MKRANLTDRAKRYRAKRNAPPGPRICNFCTSRQNVDIDHIDGDESDGDVFNLMYLCRRCNGKKAYVQKRNRIGIRTQQYNPDERRTLEGFKHAARVLLGEVPGDAARATRYIQGITPEKRAAYAETLRARNPFKSEAQRRKFGAMLGRGEITRAQYEKFARDTPPGALPERLPAKNPLFAPQTGIKASKLKGARYGLEIDVTGKGHWMEADIYPTRRQAEAEGRAIQKRDGFPYRVKATRDSMRNPPTFSHATPAALRRRFAKRIAEIKRTRGTATKVPF